MPKVPNEIHLELVLKGTFVRDLLQLLEQSLAQTTLKREPVIDEPRPLLRETGPLAVSVKEAAAIIGISRTGFFGMLKEGKVRSIRIGRRTLIPMEALEAFVAQASC